jgi:NADPH-dependent curcumin reductase CurA
MLEAALEQMKLVGRIGESSLAIARPCIRIALVACGQISQYNIMPENAYSVRNTVHIVSKRLNIRGLITNDANLAGA